MNSNLSRDENSSSNISLDGNSLAFLKSLLANKSLSKHRNTLQTVYKFVLEASENEKRLVNKCDTLQAIIDVQKNKAEVFSLKDQDVNVVINALEEQLQFAIDESRRLESEKENALDTTRKLEEYVEELKGNIKKESRDERRLQSGKQDLEEQNKVLRDKLKLHEKLIHESKLLQLQWNEEAKDLKRDLAKVSKLSDTNRAKLEREREEKDALEKELKQLRNHVEQESSRNKSIGSENVANTSNKKLQKQISTQEKQLERLHSELEQEREKLSQTNNLLTQKEELMSKQNLARAQEQEDGKQKFQSLKYDFEVLMKQNKETLENYKISITYKKKFENLQEQQKQLSKAYSEKKYEKFELQKEYEKLVNDVAGMKISIEQLEKKLQLMMEEKRAIQIQLERQVDENRKYSYLALQHEKVRENYVNEIRKLENDMRTLQLQIDLFAFKNYPKQIKELKEEKERLGNLTEKRTPDKFNTRETELSSDKSTDSECQPTLKAAESTGIRAKLVYETVGKLDQCETEKEKQLTATIAILWSDFEELQVELNQAKKENDLLLTEVSFYEQQDLLQSKAILENEIIERTVACFEQQQVQQNLEPIEVQYKCILLPKNNGDQVVSRDKISTNSNDLLPPQINPDWEDKDFGSHNEVENIHTETKHVDNTVKSASLQIQEIYDVYSTDDDFQLK